jgi:6-phosphogluconolactonase
MKFQNLGRAALACLAVPALAAVLSSCGGGHTIGYAYVIANPPTGGPQIFAFNVRSDNGALAPAQVPITAGPTGIAGSAIASVVSPDNHSLYVLYGATTNYSQGPTSGQPVGAPVQSLVVHYTIQQDTGDLTMADSSTTAGMSAVGLAIDPSGNYLYAIDSFRNGFNLSDPGPGDVTVFALNSSGALAAPTCNASAGGFTANLGLGCGYPVGFGPRGVTQTQANTNGIFLYVTNSGNTITPVSGTCYNTVSGFQVNAGGALTAVPMLPPTGSCVNAVPYPAGSLPVGTVPWAITSVIANSGGNPFVYITDFTQNQAYAYQSASNGTLSNAGLGTAGQGPINTGEEPVFVTVDPRSRFVYVSNFQAGISAFDIVASTGELTPVDSLQYGAGAGPLCIAIDPVEGIYLYAVNLVGGTVTGYTLNGSAGTLTALPNQPFYVGTSTTASNAAQPACVSVAANGSTPVIGTP